MDMDFDFMAKFLNVSFLISILRFGVVLGVLIFIHELGHFLVAKWRGIYVKRFSLGFGPRLLGFKKGETEYWISAFPLGGYVKMAGQEDIPGQEEEEDKDIPEDRKFSRKSTVEKLAVILAGPLMNVVAAFLIFTLVYTVGFQVPSYFLSSRIGGIVPDSPAQKAGLKPGDQIQTIDSRPVRNWEQLVYAMVFSRGRPLLLKVQSGDETRRVEVQAVYLPGYPYRGIGVMPFAETQIKALIEGMPAEEAGLQVGDIILSLNGRPFSMPNLIKEINRLPGKPLRLEVKRGNEVLPVSLINGSVGTLSDVIMHEGRIWYVEKGSSETAQSLEEGDQIIGINGVHLKPEEVDEYIRVHPEETLTLEVERRAEESPECFIFNIEVKTETKGMIGVQMAIYQVKEKYQLPAAIREAARKTILQAKIWILSIINLATGEFSYRELTGPIGIYLATEKMAKEGMAELIQFVATISIILGLVNLLPIPVLDGGNMVIFALEGIRKKPLKAKTMIVVQQIGLAFILLLVVLVFYNDIFHRLLRH